MRRKLKWRIISDYVGAGSFVLESTRAVVGTKQGLQCISRDARRRVAWTADLGSRCLGVRKADGGRHVATCRRGVFLVSSEGKVEKRKLFADNLVHEAARCSAGTIVTEGAAVQLFPDWDSGPAWSYNLRTALGKSVKAVRPVDVFECGDAIVAGFVDLDSGIGRVVVLDLEGKPRWISEPGPVSEVFDAGNGTFVWCVTGYGKFASRLSTLDGVEVWRSETAGLGTALGDGGVAVIAGSNESPRWDHWEYCEILADGRRDVIAKGRGRASVRPTVDPDGSVYYLGYVFHLDPTSSRVEYTNFLRMPQELLYDHLLGTHVQIPEYDIYLHKMSPESDKLEILHHVSGSFSLARPLIAEGEVVFCDGTDIIAVDR